MSAKHACVVQGVICSGSNLEELWDKTAFDIVGDINVGWNIGNTLDAYNSEKPSQKIPSYCKDPNIPSIANMWLDEDTPSIENLIDEVHKAGFNAVRVPVTWYKMVENTNGGKDGMAHEINKEWMEYIKSVVDLAYNRGMYVILNTHHDGFMFRFDTPDSAKIAVYQIWSQIAEAFNDYDCRVIFEGFNEPRRRNKLWNEAANDDKDWDWNGSTPDYIIVNEWNQIFVNTVRAVGGDNNKNRFLMLCPYGAQGHARQLDSFRLPLEPEETHYHGVSKFIFSVHIYSPHNWCHDKQGDFASCPDEYGNIRHGASIINDDINRVCDRARTLEVPVIFGEWCSAPELPEDERRIHAEEYIRRVAKSYIVNNKSAATSFWWDNRKN